MKISWTYLPYDFVLDKNKLSAPELETRLEHHGREIFYKDVPTVPDSQDPTETASTGDDSGTPVEEISPLQDFASRCRNLRNALHDLVLVRLMATFAVRSAVVKHPFGNLETLDDFLLEYHTGVYNNDKRKMVFALCYDMWGKECFGTLEKLVMDNLKLKYSNKLVGNTEPKTRRSHGSIKGMITRMRQTYVNDRFRLVFLKLCKLCTITDSHFHLTRIGMLD